jgi:hypothetical protein
MNIFNTFFPNKLDQMIKDVYKYRSIKGDKDHYNNLILINDEFKELIENA